MTPSLLNLQTLLACSPEIPHVRVHTAHLINLSLSLVFSISYHLHLFFISQASRKSSLVQSLHFLPLSYSSIHSYQAPTARLTAWAVGKAESIGTFAHLPFIGPVLHTICANHVCLFKTDFGPRDVPLPWLPSDWLLLLSLHYCTTCSLFYVF